MEERGPSSPAHRTDAPFESEESRRPTRVYFERGLGSPRPSSLTANRTATKFCPSLVQACREPFDKAGRATSNRPLEITGGPQAGTLPYVPAPSSAAGSPANLKLGITCNYRVRQKYAIHPAAIVRINNTPCIRSAAFLFRRSCYS
jgi:hypothetical protein